MARPPLRRRRPAVWLSASLFSTVGLLAPAATLAADPEPAGDRLEAVERAIEVNRGTHRRLDRKAADLAIEIERLDREKAATAAAIRAGEAETSRLEAELAELARAEAEILPRLAAVRRDMAQALSALTRLSRYPPEAMLAPALPPTDAVRAGLLLRAATTEIEGRVAGVRGELEHLAATRQAIASRNRELQTAATVLGAERQRLDRLQAQAADLHRQDTIDARETAARIRRLSNEAESLRDLMAHLESQGGDRLPPPSDGNAPVARPLTVPPAPSSPPADRPFAEVRGTMSLPVVGRMVRRYGEGEGAGLISKGITIETRPGAQIRAPYRGKVAFAGPFRGYGQLLIIEHGEGYHTLMAGMDRIDIVIGQWVSTGEAVGTMGYPGASAPRLYLELRQDNRPVDPFPWFAVGEAKVSG